MTIEADSDAAAAPTPARRWLVPALGLVCVWPAVPPYAALAVGIVVGVAGWNPRPAATARCAHNLLQLSIVALGATIPLGTVLAAGLHGIGTTFGSIVVTLLLGRLLGRLFRVPSDTAVLVSGGTAICGGTAIAALAGALRPRSEHVTVALATVFTLNAVALVAFPLIGHACGLNQAQFGWWAALAIHDTSSVVGAGLAYGSAALAIATTVKLARALWIAPLTVWYSLRHREPTEPGRRRAYVPWFIIGFVVVAALAATVPGLAPTRALIGSVAPRLFVLTLFCIGAGFTRDALKRVGLRPLALGLVLWLIVATVSLVAIKARLLG